MNKTTSSLTERDFVRLPADRSLADAIVRPSVSYWRDVLRRIRSDKVAIVSLTFLVIIILMAVLPPYSRLTAMRPRTCSIPINPPVPSTGSAPTPEAGICGPGSGWARGSP